MKKNLLFCFFTPVFLIMLTISIVAAESASSSFGLGFEKHRKGDLLHAVQYYSHAITMDPGFVMAYQMRGIAWQQMKKYPDALSDYTMVITVGEPSFKVVGYYNRGIVKNMTGDFAGAIPDFSKAIELDKKMGAAFFHRGIAKSKTGDMDGRQEDFRQAAHLGEINAEKWLNTYYPEWRNKPVSSPTLPVTPPQPVPPAGGTPE